MALRVGFAGDGGYWIVPAGVADVTVPGELTWGARLDFSSDLALGEARVRVQAVGADERGGAVREARFELVDDTPGGALVVLLEWDAQADLDLYVRGPAGPWVGPEHPLHGPDSNAGCRVDGRRREHVAWAADPPAGRYRVGVDLAGACGQRRAAWRARVLLDGAPLAAAEGVLTQADARETAAGGAPPLLALEFDVP